MSNVCKLTHVSASVDNGSLMSHNKLKKTFITLQLCKRARDAKSDKRRARDAKSDRRINGADSANG